MSKFAVYLSHSWEKRDVAFNLWVWDKLAPVCDLLVDKPAPNVHNACRRRREILLQRAHRDRVFDPMSLQPSPFIRGVAAAVELLNPIHVCSRRALFIELFHRLQHRHDILHRRARLHIVH